MPRMLPVDLARAGAITSANRIGVSSGTRISLGVWALSAKRRRERVTNAVILGDGRCLVTGRERDRGVVVTAVMVQLAFIEGGQAARLSPVRWRYTSSRVGGRVVTLLVATPDV